MNEKTEFNAEHEQPNSVWKHFVRLSEIPRCSKNEKRAVEYVKSIAETYGHSVCQDSAGNLLVRISSTDSFKDSPSVCLQSHLDMVCEKNSDAEHDFSKDPLKLYKQDGMLYAEGTTLGADNGIGAAMMIALCESSEIKHPELELLFTVDEEAGMSGAFALQSDFIQSKRLINLDTEEEGCICIGCSGGLETELNFPVTGMQPGPEFLPYRIEVKNLRGGHSGINIHLKRANAVKILARCLNRLQKSQEVYLSEINGGRARNAIPREASCIIFLKDPGIAEKILNEEIPFIEQEFTEEENIKINFQQETANTHFNREQTDNLFEFLDRLPCGVVSMSADLPGLVETSTNPGIIQTVEHQVTVGCLTRSSQKKYQRSVTKIITDLGDSLGFQSKVFGEYPPWPYNLNSKLLKDVVAILKNKCNLDIKTVAVHAGLETGILGETFSGMDMISLGPDIFFPHSPREHVSIESVDRVWKQLQAILENLQ